MKKFAAAVLVMLLASLACRLSGRATPTPDANGLMRVPDIQYADVPGAEPGSLSLDLYYYPTSTLRPVMIYVHGGAWQTGDKARVDHKPAYFAGNGFFFVSANYRLVPDVTWRDQLADLARAVGWVRDNIAEYGGDPDSLYLMGHSAGAHLVALLGTDGQYLEAKGLSLEALSGVIALDTQTYDLNALAGEDGRLPDLYGDVFGQDLAGWLEASPIAHVAGGSGIPPFVIAFSGGANGGGDPQRAEQAQAFEQALGAAGVPVLVIDGQPLSHAEINQEFGNPAPDLGEERNERIRAVTEASLEFLLAER